MSQRNSGRHPHALLTRLSPLAVLLAGLGACGPVYRGGVLLHSAAQARPAPSAPAEIGAVPGSWSRAVAPRVAGER